MDHGRLALQRCRSAMQSPPAGTRALGRQRDMKPLRADTVKAGRICERKVEMVYDIALGAVAGAAATALLQRLLGNHLSRQRNIRAPATVKHVSSPNPDWKPGDKQSPPFENKARLALDPDEQGASGMYPFTISSVIPRPIGFVASLSKEGVPNLSPYSYFNVMSHDPPYVCIGGCATSGRPSKMKDTQQNLLETKEFTINLISEWFVEAANHTCGNYDRGVNEIELSGLTPLPSVKVKAPRIEESAVQFECILRHTYDVKNKKGDITATILIGEVVLAHVLEAVTTKTGHGHIIVDIEKYAPVSRLGGDSYARVTELYDIPRPGKEWQARASAVKKA